MSESRAQQRMLELLDDGPLVAVHYRLWLLASGGILVNGISLLLLGVSIPLIAGAYELDPGQVGLIGAARVSGAVPGSLLGGKAADRFGRKRLYLVGMAVVAAGGALSTFAVGPWMLFAGQLVMSLGIGIDIPVAGAYVAETMPRRARSRMMAATIALQAAGMVLGVGLGIAVLGAVNRPGAWRGLMFMGTVCALGVLLARLDLPESPRWLMSQGRNAEAGGVVARLRPARESEATALATEAGHAAHHVLQVAETERRASMSALFRAKYRLQTGLVAVPWLLMDVATYGMALFTPVILGAMGLHEAGDDLVRSDIHAAAASALVDSFLVVGAVASLWTVPALGHLRAQMGGFAGMAAGMTAILAAVLLPGGADAHVALLFTGFIVYNVLMNAGPNATTFTLAPESDHRSTP